MDLSYDDDGEIEEWFWDFGDGETSTGQITEHQFGLPGIYYVTLSVTDDQDGTNSTIISFEVENAPPTSQIRISDGINLGNNNWKIPANRNIMIDGTVSFDNEGDELEFLWTVNGQELSTDTIYLNLVEETTLELKVIDSRGGENTEIFTIVPQNVPSLTILNWEDSTQVIKNEIGTLQTYSENGEFNLYMWKVQRLGIEINESILMDTANYDSLKPEWEEGEYFLKVSARDIETNLWTENFSMTTFVYNNPHATFKFNNTINEGQWVSFDSTESGGFWNGSNSLDTNELELIYKWTLDGEELAGTNELITTLIESGGEHTINLTVFQNPVGENYYEVEFYADYKPWGIMNTFPQNPRYGEDFEIYLNAYDEEGEAYINFLKISVYDFEDTQRAELLYEDQGSNFNLIVEIEYTGTIILEYELIDEKGNFRTNISTIEVLGWPDIYIESLEIEGTKEKGKTQNIEFILRNYNKTYESVLYNGAVAIGTVDLLINDEIVKSWNYNIEGEESQVFSFEWIAPAGYYEFEVIASASNGETILENNNMTKSATFTADVKSSILPYPNFVIVSVLFIGISVLKHRKPN